LEDFAQVPSTQGDPLSGLGLLYGLIGPLSFSVLQTKIKSFSVLLLLFFTLQEGSDNTKSDHKEHF
jgi:hypothetical protein